MDTHLNRLLEIVDAIRNVLLGGAGGIVAYMYDYSNSKRNNQEAKWSNSAMLINMFIGAFVASSLGSFIPENTVGRDGIIAFIGVTSYTILGIIESRFAMFILNRTLGISSSTTKGMNNEK